MPYADLGSFRLYYEDSANTVGTAESVDTTETADSVDTADNVDSSEVMSPNSDTADSDGAAVPDSAIDSVGTSDSAKQNATTKEALIFLHGFTLDHRLWQPQAEFFADNYRVIRPDARGHGKSDAPSTGYSRDDRVDDLAGLVNALGINKFHLVGLSMGGTTAIGYALKYQARLHSLTLVSTGIAGYGKSGRMAKLDRIAREKGVEAARSKWIAGNLLWYKDERAWIGQAMEKMMRDFSGATWADPMRGKYPRANDLERIQEIKTPVRIVAGEADRAFVPLAQLLHEKITGSELAIYDGVGHMVNLEVAERFNAELKVFLEGARS